MKSIKSIISLILILAASNIVSAQIFSSSNANIGFYSETPIENIAAESNVGVILVNTKTGDIVAKVQNTSFSFRNKLMQEHFNEKYMESEKFPHSLFVGKFIEGVDFSKNGSYDVSVVGKLTIHGVEQNRTIKGTLIVDDNKIQLKSVFLVKNKDHKIQIPDLVVTKIAEDITVKMDAVLMIKEK